MTRIKPIAGLMLLLVAPVSAQEAVRMSLASAEAEEARRKAATTLGYYNLQAGPTAWNFGVGLDLTYNDNVLLQESGQAGDFIFSPQANAHMLWPLTEKNSLSLSFGGGYSLYAQHSQLDRGFVNPGSELSFDLYVGDYWLNLHDRLSVSQNSYQDPTVTGTGNYSLLQNAMGLAGTWDLNKIILRNGYDHLNYDTLSGEALGGQGQPSGQSEIFSGSAGYQFAPGREAGLEVGGSIMHFSNTGTNTLFSDATQWNAGVFCETVLSQYVHFRGSAGYTQFSPEAHGQNHVSDFGGVYAQLSLQHRVNQYIDYTLSGGRSINFSFFGGTIDLYEAAWQIQWHVLKGFTLATILNYDHGAQAVGFGENFSRYGGGLSLGRHLSAKLSGTLAYQFYWRSSDLQDRDYLANILSLSFVYTF